MRTTIDLPDDLLIKAMQAVRARTKTQTIVLGLHELVRRSKTEQLRSARGTMDMAVDGVRARKR